MTKKILVIAGATATGKSRAAIELAKLHNAEIISADSRLVYKDLNIATAKPNLEEREGVVHHLIDVIEPIELFSAGDYEQHARKAIDDILARGKNVIIAGGTGFYISALLGGEKMPLIEADFILRKELENLSNDKLYRMLEKLDSIRAKQIHPNNRDKIIRSIEMCKVLKMPVSQYKRNTNSDFKVDCFILEAPREVLYKRINSRVDSMLKKGLYEEFCELTKKYPAEPVLKSTIGYKEFFEYEFEEAVEKIKQHTRNYAKRQFTWIKHKMGGTTFDTNDVSLEYIVKCIYKML